MNFEIYWEDKQANQVDSRLYNDKVVLRFINNNAEYKYQGSGVIQLMLTLEEQSIKEKIIYKTLEGEIEHLYQLSGQFEDDSWQVFQGTWEENGETYHFDAIADVVESSPFIPDSDELKVTIAKDEQFDDEPSNYHHKINSNELVPVPQATDKITKSYQHSFNRQRAARSDARVRTIQRKIELQYGLPEGSVKLCNPDRSIISPLAKVGTLRERWEI